MLDLFGDTFAPRDASFGNVVEKMFDITSQADESLRLSLKKLIDRSSIGMISNDWYVPDGRSEK
ncbi:hypothetical protein AB835_13745 [Candidatus Endobugula sertula]|uniref:Uncharacterized protein n=1 Tax=Candidatus Endobugula sertula TaxID=62101 RepID=A0A1D2QLT2_9GAMM|nr:hypothetical protein AB835_13745 [Candidatus Endobugula sertula]